MDRNATFVFPIFLLHSDGNKIDDRDRKCRIIRACLPSLSSLQPATCLIVENANIFARIRTTGAQSVANEYTRYLYEYGIGC